MARYAHLCTSRILPLRSQCLPSSVAVAVECGLSVEMHCETED